MNEDDDRVQLAIDRSLAFEMLYKRSGGFISPEAADAIVLANEVLQLRAQLRATAPASASPTIPEANDRADAEPCDVCGGCGWITFSAEPTGVARCDACNPAPPAPAPEGKP